MERRNSAKLGTGALLRSKIFVVVHKAQPLWSLPRLVTTWGAPAQAALTTSLNLFLASCSVHWVAANRLLARYKI